MPILFGLFAGCSGAASIYYIVEAMDIGRRASNIYQQMLAQSEFTCGFVGLILSVVLLFLVIWMAKATKYELPSAEHAPINAAPVGDEPSISR